MRSSSLRRPSPALSCSISAAGGPYLHSAFHHQFLCHPLLEADGDAPGSARPGVLFGADHGDDQAFRASGGGVHPWRDVHFLFRPLCALNHMTNRDANRGGCAQSCRWKYELYQGDTRISDEQELFSMSSKDLQAAAYIPAIDRCRRFQLKDRRAHEEHVLYRNGRPMRTARSSMSIWKRACWTHRASPFMNRRSPRRKTVRHPAGFTAAFRRPAASLWRERRRGDAGIHRGCHRL